MSASTFQILNFLRNQTIGTGAIAMKTMPNAMKRAQTGYSVFDSFV